MTVRMTKLGFYFSAEQYVQQLNTYSSFAHTIEKLFTLQCLQLNCRSWLISKNTLAMVLYLQAVIDSIRPNYKSPHNTSNTCP
jgi:hypothetical protein